MHAILLVGLVVLALATTEIYCRQQKHQIQDDARWPAPMVPNEDAGGLSIIDRPISFGPRRKALTVEYIQQHYDPGATSIEITPQMIVIHWTDSTRAEAAFAAFYPE